VAAVFLIPLCVALGARLISINWVGAVLGLTTPVPSFYAIVKGDPWQYTISLFGQPVPALFLAPMGQLAIAFLCFQSMVRQLDNPLHAPFSKGLAYAVLMLVDVLTAAVLYESGPGSPTLAVRSAAFCVAHLLASLYLIVNMTPWRETLLSWVWLIRGRRPWLSDWWLGERSENGLALLTFCGIGIMNLLLFVVGPVLWAVGRQPLQEAWPVLVSAMATMVVLVLAFGALDQWIMFLAGRGGLGMLTTLIALVVAIPHLVGHYYELEWLLILSPSYHVGRWFSDPVPLDNLVPLLGVYGAVWLLASFSLRRRMRRLERAVNKKLQQMGALQGKQGSG